MHKSQTHDGSYLGLDSKERDEETYGSGDPHSHDDDVGVVVGGDAAGHVTEGECEDGEHDEVARPAATDARAAHQREVGHQEHSVGEAMKPSMSLDEPFHSLTENTGTLLGPI